MIGSLEFTALELRNDEELTPIDKVQPMSIKKFTISFSFVRSYLNASNAIAVKALSRSLLLFHLWLNFRL
jgi:hypothetical protein